MSEEGSQPAANTLSVGFVPSAWRRNLEAGSLLALVALLRTWRWMRADEIARSYSDFWGLDPPQLPRFCWLGLDTWFGLAILIRSVALRLRRDPHLRIGEDEIRPAAGNDPIRDPRWPRPHRRRQPAPSQVRWENGASFAGLCARTRDVPLGEVGAFGRVRQEQGETGSHAG